MSNTARYSSGNAFFPTPLAFDAPLGGSRRNIGTLFAVEKLEWCGYPMVKNIEDMFIRFDMIHERDRQTDRHCMPT